MRKPIEAKNDKTKYVYDKVLGMIDGFNAPEYMPRFTRAEYTAQLEKCNELLKENLLDNAGKIAQIEKKLEEAYQVIREASEETGNRDLSMFLKSIEQEESDE